MKLFSTLPLIFLLISTITYGQSTKPNKLDPYGFVTKYDSTFVGIGPKVYILPLPRTLEDEMIDTYKEIQSFQDSIRLGFQYERLLANFKNTSNDEVLTKIFPDSISTKESEELLQHYIKQQNHAIIYAFHNKKALDYLHQHKSKEAIEALQTAILHATSINNIKDMAIIHSNLGSTYLLSNRFDEALKNESKYLEHALDSKNIADQASSHSRIALIQAYNKDYKTAENTIIRKAIPLFNKSKFYSGKVGAWIILAEIYRIQNKHTEAQWFLLQARDLAKDKGYEKELPMIEYMLGSSKLIQNNYRVAKNELENAWNLAQNSPNSYLKLATAEQLGRTYVYLKDYETAKNYLDHYRYLKKAIL